MNQENEAGRVNFLFLFACLSLIVGWVVGRWWWWGTGAVILLVFFLNAYFKYRRMD